ncbi:MAG TPA: hypothetical protein PKA00_15935 [Saprospiraceae bacterium]|nr:hypothetical protein [Saprospiraceae bacterium]HMQ84405.1 hypothetical protein [Saprospiraceae bacterium]
MENNLHQNESEEGLKAFLKKSFEQHEHVEAPSDELWQRIESELPAPSKPLLFLPRKLMLAASILLVLGLMIGQHLYYHSTIKRLRQALQDTQSSLENQTETAEQANQVGTASSPASSLQQQPTNPIATQEQGSDNWSEQQNPILKNNNHRFFSSFHTEKTLPSAPVMAERGDTNLTKMALNGQVLEKSWQQEGHLSLDLSPVISGILQEVHSIQDHDALPIMAHVAPIDPITPLKKGKSVGAYAHWLNTQERITGIESRPGPGGDPPIQDQLTQSGTTQAFGLFLKSDLKDHWYWQLGAEYQQSSFSAVHQPNLEFRDRRPHHGGDPHSEDYAFNYSLNTPAGVVDIEVRAEQTEAGENIPEDEPIDLVIHTRQQTDYLNFPIVLGKTIGQGRLHLNLNAGLVTSVLLNDRFEVDEVLFRNPRLRGLERDPHQETSPALRRLSFDYLLSAGVAYDLNRRLQLYVAPVLKGSISRRHNDPYIDSFSTSAGVQSGLVWQF